MRDGWRRMRDGGKSGLGDKRRFIGFIAAIIAIGFGGSSLLAFLAARSAVRAAIEGEALPAAADSIYSQIRTDLVKPVFASSMMAHDTFLHDWSASGESDLAAIENYLGEIVRRNGALTAFFVSERTKRYYYADGVLKTVREDEVRDTWYYRVRSMKQDYELNVDIDMAHKDMLTIFVNYRVIDRHGRFLGAAGIGISASTLRDMIVRYRSELSTSIYFVDSKGKIVAGSPYGRESAPLTALASDPQLDRSAAKALAAHGGAFRYEHGGETVLTRALWLPELSWFVFVEKAEGGSVALARKALYLNIVLCALVLLLVLVASALTINRFQSRLEQSASHDPLTGALNRLAFGAMAEHEIKAARRSGASVSAVMFDIDDFKRVNDEFGHPAGDTVLLRVVRSAAGAIRSSDMLCRWGGEEFLVLLPDCALDGAREIAEKMRAAIRAETAANCPCSVSVSAGVASVDAAALRAAETELASVFDELVGRADGALLEAKQKGKDRTVTA
jgi:diguanylate cyclase (GGDEF)-like protein